MDLFLQILIRVHFHSSSPESHRLLLSGVFSFLRSCLIWGWWRGLQYLLCIYSNRSANLVHSNACCWWKVWALSFILCCVFFTGPFSFLQHMIFIVIFWTENNISIWSLFPQHRMGACSVLGRLHIFFLIEFLKDCKLGFKKPCFACEAFENTENAGFERYWAI